MMRRWRLPGFTLPEVMVTMGVIMLIFSAILGLMTHTSQIFNRTSGHFGAQNSEMVALKRMDKDLREATAITLNSSTWITLIPPLKSSSLNSIGTGTNGQPVLQTDTAHLVQYFVGTSTSTTPNSAGNTLYRAVGTGSSFPGATPIISGISGTPYVPSPGHLGQYVQSVLFQLPSTNQLVVTLSIPVTETTGKGAITNYHVLQTQFYMRNITGS